MTTQLKFKILFSALLVVGVASVSGMASLAHAGTYSWSHTGSGTTSCPSSMIDCNDLPACTASNIGSKTCQSGDEVCNLNRTTSTATYYCSYTPSPAISCTSAANSCGMTNTGTEPDGGSGGQASCTATTPANPAGYGNACTSAANSCGMTNSGTINCSGACTASTPSGSLCPVIPPTCQQTNTCAPTPTCASAYGSGWTGTYPSCTAPVTAPSCTSSNACAANTCSTTTCSDSCGNTYQGTKSCVVVNTTPSGSITASPSTITLGSSSTLTYSSSNVTSCSINGTSVSTSGTQTVSPTVTTSYTFSCSGSYGTFSSTATVTVNGSGGSGGGSAPTCAVSNQYPNSANPSVTLTATPAAGGTGSYTFTSTAGTVTQASPILTVPFQYLPSGTYSVSVTQGASSQGFCPLIYYNQCSGTPTPTVSVSVARVKSGSSTTITTSGANVNTSCVLTNNGTTVRTDTPSSCSVSGANYTVSNVTTQHKLCYTCDGGTPACVVVNVIPGFSEF